VQGQGERRWQWNRAPAKDRTFIDGLPLRILAKPAMDCDEVLSAGDMLYLPPGFAHHGVAVTPCLTYSVGFRAPNAREAWMSFAAAAKAGTELLADPPLSPATEPGAIPPALLKKARALIRSIDSSDEAIDRWFAAHTTRLKPGHTFTPPKRLPDIEKGLKAGKTIARSEEGRWAFLPRKGGLCLWLYVGGNEVEVPAAASPLAKLLCSARRHVLRPKNAPERALLERLFALGALQFA
jgi:50S ribosomal protein L16 3-hydroxylase